MEIIEAYKCKYCGKIYERKGSCKTHEYKCHFNPKNQSCASCAFMELYDHGQDSEHVFQFRICLANKSVAKDLHTNCEKHMQKKYREDKDIMGEMYRSFDKDKAITEGLELFKGQKAPF